MARIFLQPPRDHFRRRTDVEVIRHRHRVKLLSSLAPGDYTLDGPFSHGGDTSFFRATLLTTPLASRFARVLTDRIASVHHPVRCFGKPRRSTGRRRDLVVVAPTSSRYRSSPGLDNSLGDGAVAGSDADCRCRRGFRFFVKLARVQPWVAPISSTPDDDDVLAAPGIATS